MIVRWLLRCAIWKQFPQLDPQHLDEVIEFKIQHEFQTRLDFGNPANLSRPQATPHIQ